MIATENRYSTNHLVARMWPVCLGLGLALTALGCGSGTPLQPTSLGTPQLVQPADGAQVANNSQPITLVTQNVTVTGTTIPTYTFEVATDSAFTSKVQTKASVAQGTGQTAVQLDSLAPGKDYYWHVRAQTASATGTFSAAYRFTLGAVVTINAPTAISPANGALTPVRPTFTVSNVTREGATSPITYEFDISTTSGFGSILVRITVGEGQGQTSFTPSSDLPANTSLFWRAIGMDAASGVAGPPSAAQAFTTGSAIWSGAQPPGTNGHAVLGDNWQTQQLVSFNGISFTSPTLDQLQVFDLIDRGMNPQGAIDWMHANGYSTDAAYFSNVNVIGFQFSYLALVRGRWDLVIRSGA